MRIAYNDCVENKKVEQMRFARTSGIAEVIRIGILESSGAPEERKKDASEE